MRSRGVTLVELLVVLAILGIMAGITGLTWRSAAWDPVRGDDPRPASLARLRQRAIDTGKPTAAVVTLGEHPARVMVLPDGRVVGAWQLGVNPLTGRVIGADTLVR